jgi:hypothetical protein
MNLFPINLARVEVSRVQCPPAFVLTFWSEDGWTTPYTYYLFSGQTVEPLTYSYVNDDGEMVYIEGGMKIMRAN